MKNFNSVKKYGFICAIIIALLSSCKKDNKVIVDPVTPVVEVTGPDLNFFALTSDNVLLTLNARNASSITAQVSITGLQTGESLLSIDFRPATGQLYGVGSSSRIYIINTQSGVARAVGTTSFTPAISGTAAGIDFNPTVDRIRLVSSAGQNLRLNPETGTVAATDGNINGADNAAINAVAYTQNRAGASTTTLYDIDVTRDKLYKQDPPNDGKLTEVGSIGFDIQKTAGFDISPDGATALAAFNVAGKINLYIIDLATGKGSRVANAISLPVIDLAVPTEPVAYAISSNNELVIFNPLSPAPVNKAITGLQTGETIVGIDFRPLNGQLYALGSTSRLYTLNASSGVAAAVSTVPFATLLTGTDFGFDFNPTVDRVRVISNTGQNLRLNPLDGTIAAVDGIISPGTPSVTAAAYTNNFAGATTTVLFDIDTQTSRLYKQDPPNTGTLVDVGPLGVSAASANGFDIGGTSGTAYALLTVAGTTKVYTINLQTGAATAGATLTGTVKAFTLGLGF